MTDIYLEGTVGESFWGEQSFTASDVRAQLVGVTGPITVYINSGGGVASEGAAIYNTFCDYSAKHGSVTMICQGVAASAASLIYMAGDLRVMSPGSFLLIHDPAAGFTDGRGTQADHERMAGQLEVIAEGYASVYADRAGMSPKEARDNMRAETVWTPEMAVQMGFATAVDAGLKQKVAAAFDYRIYANAPRALREAQTYRGKTPENSAVLAMVAGSARFLENEMNDIVEAAQETPSAKITMAERRRVKRILSSAAVAKVSPEMAQDLIDRGVSLEDALDQITAAWKEAGDIDTPMMGRPTYSIGQSFDGPHGFRAKVADAVAARLAPKVGLRHDPTIGREFADMTFPDMLMASVRMNGFRPRTAAEALMNGAHGTSDFTIAVGQGLTSIVAKGIQQAPAAIARAAAVIDAMDYRTGFAVNLTGATKMQAIAESGEIKSGTIDERGEAKAFPVNQGLKILFTREAQINDSTAMQLLSNAVPLMLRSAVERQREILLAPLVAASGLGQTMRDTLTLFHVTHGNLAATGAVPSVGTLSTGRTAMRRQMGSRGEVFALEPWAILVPPELETLAQQLVASLAANVVTSVNPFANSLEIIVEPGLVNPNAWYLVANPTLAEGLTIAYLDGQKSPIIETREAWDTVGTEYRMLWPMGAAFHEYASWYRNPGV